MDDKRLEGELNELAKEFQGTHNPQYVQLAKLARQAKENHKQLQRSINTLQESLDYLRICIKYQVFDLEATRRENKYLRDLLEERDS